MNNGRVGPGIGPASPAHARRRTCRRWRPDAPCPGAIAEPATHPVNGVILLTRQPAACGDIVVVDRFAGGTRGYFQGGYCQSEADAEGVSLSSYIHAIYGLLAQTAAHHVLMIGCGGGTLATMLARIGRRVTVVDVDPMSFQLARAYFGLPADVACHVHDGGNFLERCEDRYDAIVIDAFVGGDIPRHLRSIEFFVAARRRLAGAGCLVANAMVRDDLDARARLIAANIAATGLPVRLLDAPGRPHRNAIVAAGAVEEFVPPQLLVKPRAGAADIVEDLARLRFHPWRSNATGRPRPCLVR